MTTWPHAGRLKATALSSGRQALGAEVLEPFEITVLGYQRRNSVFPAQGHGLRVKGEIADGVDLANGFEEYPEVIRSGPKNLQVFQGKQPYDGIACLHRAMRRIEKPSMADCAEELADAEYRNAPYGCRSG